MAQGIELVTLRCNECGASMAAQSEGVFLHCPACGAGYEVTSTEELNKIPVYFAKYQQDSTTFYPFWTFDATLELLKRETKASLRSLFGSSKGLIELFEERHAIRMYTPAYLSDIDQKKPYGLFLTYEQPKLQYLPSQKTLPAVLFRQEDARLVADYLFLTSEIEQADTMRSLKYNLHLTNPMLLAIAL